EFADGINPNLIRGDKGPLFRVVTYAWVGDLNGNGLLDADEYNPTPLNVFTPKSNSINPNLRNPKTDEITFGYERVVTDQGGVSALWVQRWFKDQTVDSNVGIPTSAYVPHAFTDPGPDNVINTGDDRTITFYDVGDAYLGKDAFVHTNSPGIQRYK